MRPHVRLLLALSFGVLIGMSCRFTFTDDVIYACKADGDCGGGGFVCTAGACCHATGDEACGDGLDNDCDGRVDGAGTDEVCNGRDDDCDGTTDEGFDLQQSPTNCGTCGTTCDTTTQRCRLGTCERRTESDCGNGLDDDLNGSIDCDDPGCNLAACGSGCLCAGTTKAEVLCDDGVDNDGDGQLDCTDPDCVNKSCGAGCACIDGVRKETNCADQLDNDQDGGADCDDPVCEAQFCLSGTTQKCVGTACLCNGGAMVPEVGALCADGLDNDCDNQFDCREAACDQQSCDTDGGAGCVCAGGKKSESGCANLIDDDGDALVDCADLVDCPALSPCTAMLGGAPRAGQCGMSGQCVAESCSDGVDNDGDTQVDCVDTDCDGYSCAADGGLASDGGAACLCTGAAKVEVNCSDRSDNDGDALVDCADFQNCPQGTACTRTNNQPGVCQTNHTCN